MVARLVATLHLGEWYEHQFMNVFAAPGPPAHLADLPGMAELGWHAGDHDPLLVEWAERHWPAIWAARLVLADPVLGRVMDIADEEAPEWVRLFRDGCAVSIDLGCASPLGSLPTA